MQAAPIESTLADSLASRMDSLPAELRANAVCMESNASGLLEPTQRHAVKVGNI